MPQDSRNDGIVEELRFPGNVGLGKPMQPTTVTALPLQRPTVMPRPGTVQYIQQPAVHSVQYLQQPPHTITQQILRDVREPSSFIPKDKVLVGNRVDQVTGLTYSRSNGQQTVMELKQVEQEKRREYEIGKYKQSIYDYPVKMLGLQPLDVPLPEYSTSMLPTGWRSELDPVTGCYKYINDKTKKETWDFPRGTVLPGGDPGTERDLPPIQGVVGLAGAQYNPWTTTQVAHPRYGGAPAPGVITEKDANKTTFQEAVNEMYTMPANYHEIQGRVQRSEWYGPDGRALMPHEQYARMQPVSMSNGIFGDEPLLSGFGIAIGRYRNGALPAQNPTARSNWSISGQALIRTKSWDSDRHDWVFQVNWLDGNGDILFHFNPRPNEGKIVMNSRKYKDKKKTNNKNGFSENDKNGWEREVSVELPASWIQKFQDAKWTVLADDDGFHVTPSLPSPTNVYPPAPPPPKMTFPHRRNWALENLMRVEYGDPVDPDLPPGINEPAYFGDNQDRNWLIQKDKYPPPSRGAGGRTPIHTSDFPTPVQTLETNWRPAPATIQTWNDTQGFGGSQPGRSGNG